jgi:valyl-tRNA synthetase
MWQTLYSNETIHKQLLPKPQNVEEMSKFTKDIMDFNSKVWNEKKSKGLSLKDSIVIVIPQSLKIFAKDLISMHRLQA